MTTDPRIQRNLRKMQEQGASNEEMRAYLKMEGIGGEDGPITPDKPDVGMARGLALSALRAVPFSDELGSAIRSVPRLMPGGKSFGDAYGENMQASREGLESFQEDHPVLSGATTLAATIPTAISTGGLGAVRGAAALGAADAAGAADGGLLNRLKAGAIGGTLGALLGKAGDKLFKAAPGVASTGTGAVMGAAAAPGDAGLDWQTGAGALAGAAAGRGAANRLVPAAERATGKLAQALSRAKVGIDKLRNPGDVIPETTVMELGGPQNPVIRTAGSAYRTQSEGAQELGGFLARRSKLQPSSAERAVNKAMGSNYVDEQPAITRVRSAIRGETAPDYAALKDVRVSADALTDWARREPLVADLWRSAQQLSRERAAAGFGDAVDMPDLFGATPIATTAKDIPVLGLDMVKRALRHEVQKRANSPNAITTEKAKVLNKELQRVMAAAKDESPQYAETLAKFGRVSNRYKKGMESQKQTADAVLGNSATAGRLKDDADFGSQPSIRNLLNVREQLAGVVDSKFGRWLSGMDEQTVDELAPMLMADLSDPAARAQLAARLEEYMARRGTRAGRLGNLPRIAAGGAGIGIGELNRDSGR